MLITHTRRGVALVLVLSLVSLLATFATLVTTKARAAIIEANNYKQHAQALFLAQAGLQRALYELKFNPQSGQAACAGSEINAYDAKTESWYYGDGPETALADAVHPSFAGLHSSVSGYSETIGTTGKIKLKIIDNASKIAINDPDTTGLQTLLENLFAVVDPPVPSSIASNIITQRPALTFNAGTGAWQGGYRSVFDLRRFLTEEQFTAVKEYLTAYSFIDHKLIEESAGDIVAHGIPRYQTISSDSKKRAPINMNTASVPVLQAVFRTLPTLNNATADELARRLAAYTDTNPITTWEEFYSFLAAQNGLSFTRDRVFAAVNPNRPKATQYTTDLCFASEGYFSINSRGEVFTMSHAAAVYELSLECKIYDIFRISTRDDFIGAFVSPFGTNTDSDNDGLINPLDITENDFSPVPFNTADPYESLLDTFGEPSMPGFIDITWFDSTPIGSYAEDSGGQYQDGYEHIPGALKLGFWDNFDEAPAESCAMWQAENSFYNGPINAALHIHSLNGSSYFAGTTAESDGDNELWQDFIDDPMDDTVTVRIKKMETDAYGNEVPVITYETYAVPYAESTDDDFTVFKLYDYYKTENLKAPNLVNTYRWWEGSMYLRAAVTEGPRAVASEPGNIPGILGTDMPGRDYLDVGHLVFRFNDNQSEFTFLDFTRKAAHCAISTTGNYYDYEAKFRFNTPPIIAYDMDGSGDIKMPWETGGRLAIRNATNAPEPVNGLVDLSGEPFDFMDMPQPDARMPNAPNLSSSVNMVFGLTPAPWDMDSMNAEYFSSVPLLLNGSLSSLREKTYRVFVQNNVADIFVAAQGLGSGFQHELTYPLPVNLVHGSVFLYPKDCHPAWDDIRIIGNTGVYTTAAFMPGDLGSSNDSILWGTVAWTETMNSKAPSRPQCSVSLISPQSTDPGKGASYGFVAHFSSGGTGGPIRNSNGPAQYPNQYMRLHIRMGCDIDHAGTEPPAVPVFEDATITYLPKTKVYYVRANN